MWFIFITDAECKFCSITNQTYLFFVVRNSHYGLGNQNYCLRRKLVGYWKIPSSPRAWERELCLTLPLKQSLKTKWQKFGRISVGLFPATHTGVQRFHLYDNDVQARRQDYEVFHSALDDSEAPPSNGVLRKRQLCVEIRKDGTHTLRGRTKAGDHGTQSAYVHLLMGIQKILLDPFGLGAMAMQCYQ